MTELQAVELIKIAANIRIGVYALIFMVGVLVGVKVKQQK
jgi:hypothetical protein